MLGATVGLLAGGLIAASAPASAGSLSCDPITVGHQNYIDCDLIGAASPPQSKWTVNGTYLSGLDNQTTIKVGCLAGQSYTVRVSYRSSTGVASSGVSTVRCGAGGL